MLVLLAWATSLPAQIMREQADTIVLQHIQNEVSVPYLLYVYNHAPSEDEMVITTYNEEKIKIKYACWAYYLNENPELTEPCQHRYLFVKANDGNLLEITTSNDLTPTELSEWATVGVANWDRSQEMLLYPNPTTGELRIMNYELRIEGVEVFDVYGRKLLEEKGERRKEKGEWVLNLSHLPAGIYFVKIRNEAGEVVKKVVKQ